MSYLFTTITIPIVRIVTTTNKMSITGTSTPIKIFRLLLSLLLLPVLPPVLEPVGPTICYVHDTPYNLLNILTNNCDTIFQGSKPLCSTNWCISACRHLCTVVWTGKGDSSVDCVRTIC